MKAQPRSSTDMTLFVIEKSLYYTLPIEDWKDYYASTCGKIISTKGHKPAVLANRQNNGYCYVILSNGKLRKQCRVHRLIAQTFLETPANDPTGHQRVQVNHIDSDPANNKVANLEWCSPLENSNHAVMMKRIRDDLPAGNIFSLNGEVAGGRHG